MLDKGQLVLLLVLTFGIPVWFIHRFIGPRPEVCAHGIRKGRFCRDCEAERKMQSDEQMREFPCREEAFRFNAQEKDRVEGIRLKRFNHLISLSPAEFEDVMAVMFRRLGYEVVQTPLTRDQGKDAILRKEGLKYLL